MKRQNIKGFTLVEIIVVLVIIAILAATTLPALSGYISEARDKTAISEARTYLTAAQTIASELYGLGASEANITKWLSEGNRGSGKSAVPASFTKTVATQTGSDIYASYARVKNLQFDDSGKQVATIMLMEYYATNGRSVVYDNGKLSIGDTKGNKP